MMVSTGTVSPYTTNAVIRRKLEETAAFHGRVIKPETIKIHTPRPGMKVGVCETEIAEETTDE